MKTIFLVLSLSVLLPMASAYTVSVFSPSTQSSNLAAMDAALGITGYTIGDFESGTFLSGLSYSQTDLTFAIESSSPGNAWDGISSLRATFNGSGTFTYTPGASSFGFGMAANGNGAPDSSRTIQINGGTAISFQAFPAYVPSNAGLNGYIRIDAQQGDAAITSVRINLGGQGETIAYDRIAVLDGAVSTVPEPSTMVMFFLSLFCLAYQKKNQR